MKSNFVSKFSVRVKIVAGKTLMITITNHQTGEINVHAIDIFDGKQTDEGKSSEDKQVDQDELIEEQLEEGN